MSDLIHHGTLCAGLAAVTYTAAITTTTLTAVLARSPTRRRDTREVLKILIRRRNKG